MTPSPRFIAFCAVCGVIIPSSAILASTSLRRASAFSGARTGEYVVGAWGRPASSAASCSLRSSTDFPKYTREAAWTPTAVWPPSVPNGTVLRYLSRIHALECSFSSSSASLASRILRW